MIEWLYINNKRTSLSIYLCFKFTLVENSIQNDELTSINKKLEL